MKIFKKSLLKDSTTNLNEKFTNVVTIINDVKKKSKNINILFLLLFFFLKKKKISNYLIKKKKLLLFYFKVQFSKIPQNFFYKDRSLNLI